MPAQKTEVHPPQSLLLDNCMRSPAQRPLWLCCTRRSRRSRYVHTLRSRDLLWITIYCSCITFRSCTTRRRGCPWASMMPWGGAKTAHQPCTCHQKWTHKWVNVPLMHGNEDGHVVGWMGWWGRVGGVGGALVVTNSWAIYCWHTTEAVTFNNLPHIVVATLYTYVHIGMRSTYVTYKYPWNDCSC